MSKIWSKICFHLITQILKIPLQLTTAPSRLVLSQHGQNRQQMQRIIHRATDSNSKITKHGNIYTMLKNQKTFMFLTKIHFNMGWWFYREIFLDRKKNVIIYVLTKSPKRNNSQYHSRSRFLLFVPICHSSSCGHCHH